MRKLMLISKAVSCCAHKLNDTMQKRKLQQLQNRIAERMCGAVMWRILGRCAIIWLKENQNMSYEILEKSYATLTDEQQMIVYNLVVSLEKLNSKKNDSPQKRIFGKFSGTAIAVFSDDWEMTEEELCD